MVIINSRRAPAKFGFRPSQNGGEIFIKKLTENKLLTIRAAENVVRILPPLNVKKNELDQALKIINKVCAEL